MKAIRAADGRVEVVDVPRPEGAGVRVRVRSAGICGSDLHMLEAGFVVDGILGHEIAGETSDGRLVAIEPIAPCNVCESCRQGTYNLCTTGPQMWIGTGTDGGMAEEILVPDRCLVPLPGGLAISDACLVEPLAVAIHATRRAGLRSGERAVVVGGGTIGLCTVAAVHATGARVALEARHDVQRAAGERLGVEAPTDGYDVCFEASGTASGFARAAEICRPGGRIALVGTFWESCEIPAMQVCMKELDILPASAYARAGAIRDIDCAASLLGRRPEIASTLITHRFPLEAGVEAFETAARRSEGSIKVVLEP
jgi:threonine dehydrogenase-like Zn-dependent dehydrogenase